MEMPVEEMAQHGGDGNGELNPNHSGLTTEDTESTEQKKMVTKHLLSFFIFVEEMHKS